MHNNIKITHNDIGILNKTTQWAKWPMTHVEGVDLTDKECGCHRLHSGRTQFMELNESYALGC